MIILTRDVGEFIPEILAFGLKVSPCRSRASLGGTLDEPRELFGSPAGAGLDVLTDLSGVDARLGCEIGFR